MKTILLLIATLTACTMGLAIAEGINLVRGETVAVKLWAVGLKYDKDGKLMPPQKPEEVEMHLLTADGAEWVAKWERKVKQ